MLKTQCHTRSRCQKSHFSFRRALSVAVFFKVTIRKKKMYDSRLQERGSHLGFKLCNFLTDDWEKNKEAANNKGQGRKCAVTGVPRGLTRPVPRRKHVSKQLKLSCFSHNPKQSTRQWFKCVWRKKRVRSSPWLRVRVPRGSPGCASQNAGSWEFGVSGRLLQSVHVGPDKHQTPEGVWIQNR